MLVVAVAERAQRHRGLGVLEGDPVPVVFGGERRGDFQGGEDLAGVAVGAGDEVGDGVVVDGEVVVTEAARVG